MDLKEIICGPSYEVTGETEVSYRGITFKYITALKKAEGLEYSYIGEYFLLELTEENSELLFSNNTIDEFNNFQNELFINRFFKYKNDLRWNLYLILIASNNDIIGKIPVGKVENDDNYARKFIFTEEDARSFFDSTNYIKGPSLSGDAENIPNDPIADWVSILSKISLTGALDSYQKSNVKQYIEKGEPLNAEELRLSNGDERSLLRDSNNFVCTHIKEINMGSFRNHCFGTGTAVLPARVNLFHGSNGSGKTSILECIEFAITNEIKHCKEFRDSYLNQSSSVKLIMNDGKELALQSGKDRNVCKILDNVWYGSPYAKGNTACTLNSNFNHFNNFNSETIYSFALEESSKDTNYNYSDKLARLFYNDEVISLQKNWMRYKEAFDDELSSLKKKERDFNIRLGNIEAELKSTNISVDNTYTVSREFLDKLKLKMHLEDQYTISSLTEEYEKIDQVLKSITPNIAKLKENINTVKLHGINEIIERKNKLDADIEVLKLNYKTKFQEKVKKEKDLSNLYLRNDKIKLDLESHKKRLQYSDETIENWNKYKLIIKNPNKISEIETLKKNLLYLSNKLNIIESTKIKYPNIISMNEDDIFQESEDVINSNKNKLSACTSGLSEIDNIIKSAKNNISASIFLWTQPEINI